MDRLEQQLRSVLTDERLDVHLAPGAVQAVHAGVRRRRRRNAALSGVASFALVVGAVVTAVAATQGGHAVVEPGQHNPTPSTPPSHTDAPPVPGLRQGVVIPWNPTSYDPSKPFPLAGTTPDSDVPWCGAGQLTLTASQFQGATGSAAGTLTLTNNGNVCGIQGSPVITGYDGDKAIATSQAGDPFLVHPWVALQHGEAARSFVQMFGDGSRCLGSVKRFGVDLGHGVGLLSVDMSDSGDTSPRCATAPKDKQLDHYVVSAADWTGTDGSPRLPMGDFSATIGEQPVTAMQGTTVRYRVLLSTRGASVDPCLPYRQQLVSLDGTQTAVGTSYFLLDCAAIANDPAQSYELDMQLSVPKDAPVGTYALQWQTPITSLKADEAQTLRVTAAPAACRQDQLDFSVGPTGAATGHYGVTIEIRNTSGAACSLRGYPGVQFVNADGKAMRTRPHHGSSFLWQTDSYETVKVAPGAFASFSLGGVDQSAGGLGCPTASVVKVIAPGLFTQVPIEIQWPYCRAGRVDVSPVVAGVRGPR